MAVRYYYLMSALPALPALFEPLPLAPKLLLSLVRQEDHAAVTLVDAVLAELDLWAFSSNVQAYHAASVLANEWKDQPVHKRWFLYEERLLELATSLPCPFLAKITLFENRLKRALEGFRTATAPAASLASDDVPNTVFLEGDARKVASNWSLETSPYAGYRRIISDRFRWLKHEWPLEPFGIDELCAYAKTLTLLHRVRMEAAAREVQLR